MLRREDHAGGAEDRVDTRGEDADLHVRRTFQGEVHLGSFAAADPVLLHRQHAIGPLALEILDRVEQFLRVVGDPQEPLIHLTLLDRRLIVTPAAAVDHLLVGEHGLAFVAPVQQRGLAIGEAAFVHLQKEPLVPLVVLGFASGDFAVPVVAEVHPLVLTLHLADVVVRPLAGMALVVDGGVFGGQAEGVPTHRVQDVEAAHPLIARQRVADRVVAEVADVERAARIRKHFEDVILRFRRVLFRSVQFGILAPDRMPLGFDLLVIVRTFRHKRGELPI